MKKLQLLIAFICFSSVFAQDKLPNLDNIAEFENKQITICEKVTSTYESKSGNVLLNFGAKYPDNSFSVMIFKAEKDTFSYNPLDLKDKTICITGTVILFKGKPEIIVKNESEIVLKK